MIRNKKTDTTNVSWNESKHHCERQLYTLDTKNPKLKIRLIHKKKYIWSIRSQELSIHKLPTAHRHERLHTSEGFQLRIWNIALQNKKNHNTLKAPQC